MRSEVGAASIKSPKLIAESSKNKSSETKSREPIVVIRNASPHALGSGVLWKAK